MCVCECVYVYKIQMILVGYLCFPHVQPSKFMTFDFRALTTGFRQLLISLVFIQKFQF